MRTTLNIDDALYRRAKAYAALSGTSVTSVIEESLRERLQQLEAGRAVAPMPLSDSKGGLSPDFVRGGADINDTSALLDFLDSAIP
ncbi:MAG: DUF2191 domain-containing protein [Actinomycetota bacterium]